MMHNDPIKVLFYDESCLEYFKKQRSIAEGKLSFWKSRLDSSHYPVHYAEEKCAKYGSIISYYNDAIRRLENKAVLDNLASHLEDDGK